MADNGGPTRPPLGKLKALIFTSLGHLANDGATAFVPIVVDLLSSLRGATPSEVLVLLSSFYFTSAAASVLIGMRADATGAPGALMGAGIACLGVGVGGFGAALVFASSAELFGWALACDVMMGIGSSFYHPLGGSILQSAFGRGATGRALGLNGSMGSLGRAVYPSLLLLIAAGLTYPGSLWLFGGVEIGLAFAIWAGLGKSGARAGGGGSRRPSFRGSLSKPMVMLLVVAFFLQASFSGVTAYTPIFLTTQRGFGIGSLLGIAIAALYAPAIPGQPFFGFLSDRIDRRVVVAISGVGGGFAMLGLALTTGAVSVAFLGLFGFFSFTGFPVLLSLTSNYSSEGSRALGNSLIWGLGVTTGAAVGPVLVYAITLDRYARLGGSFEAMAALAVASGIGALLIPRPRSADA